MRVFLIFLLLLIVGGVAGFFYLVNQADAGAPPAGPMEVEIDVDLTR